MLRPALLRQTAVNPSARMAARKTSRTPATRPRRDRPLQPPRDRRAPRRRVRRVPPVALDRRTRQHPSRPAGPRCLRTDLLDALEKLVARHDPEARFRVVAVGSELVRTGGNPFVDLRIELRRYVLDESSQQALSRMRDAQVRHLSEQAPTQRASSGSMPLVASDGADEAFGSPSRFRDGVDHRFVAARVASGVRRAGINATRRLVDARSSAIEALPTASRRRPGLSGDARALPSPAAAKALACARNRVNSRTRSRMCRT